MKIKYNFELLRKAIFIFFILLMSLISCFLHYEYSFFKDQSKKLIELREDYKTYIEAVNKILIDYNKVKEKSEKKKYKQYGNQVDNLVGDQVDNQVDDIFFYDEFPKDVHVFSSDASGLESFFVLNRDLDYLRDSALHFINNQDNFGSILDAIDWSDWCEYTDYGLSKISISDSILKKAKAFKNRPRKSRKASGAKTHVKRRKKVSSYVGSNTNSRKKTRDSSSSRAKIGLSWPVERSRFWISSLYGPRKKRNGAWGFHYGVDMASLKGTPVYAACSGIIVEARYATGYGNTIVVAHSRCHRTRYAHLSKILVSVGQKVKRSQLIGKVGDTGYVRSSKGRDASHLHFELIEFGKKINPLPFIRS